MEFKSLRNIETSFRYIRSFTIVYLVLSSVVNIFVVWQSHRLVEAQREKIYILDNGKSLMLALSQDMQQNRPAEAQAHIGRFHKLFYTLSPDKAGIESNITRALFLADKNAYNHYKDLSESGYYNRIIGANINQRLIIDSIDISFHTYPYEARTYARQVIRRESNTTQRSLITTCKLVNTNRSDNNPHGFMIEGFEVTENRDIRN